MRLLHTLPWVVLPASAELSLSRSANQSPVQKIVKMLNQMKVQLAEESKADEKMFKDLACWCKTNEKQKTAAIEEGGRKMEELAGVVNAENGKAGAATAEHKKASERAETLKQEIKDSENNCARDIADAEKKQKELVQTVGALKNAITILSKHNSLLQEKPSLIQSMQSIIHFTTQESKIVHGSSPKMKRSFLQAATEKNGLTAAINDNFQPVFTFDQSARQLSSFLQSTQPSDGYSSQSGGIFGILSAMLDDFERDLSDTQESLKSGVSGCTEVRRLKQQELAATVGEVETQRKAAGDAQYAAAEATEEKGATEEAVTADKAVLQGLQTKCQNLGEQQRLRSEARSAERTAVDEAIKILIDDENREALHPSFIQMRSSSASHMKARQQRRRGIVANILTTAATKLNNSMLDEKLKKRHQEMFNQAAMKSRLDAFTEVKIHITNMVEDIKTQMAQDVKDKERCGTTIRDTEKSLLTHQLKLQETQKMVEGKEAEKATALEEIANLEEQLSETKLSIELASKNRADENEDNRNSANDQNEMHAVLQEAYTVLKTHYEKNAFLEVRQPLGSGLTDMPGEIKEYSQSTSSGGVLAMFEQIMNDCVKDAAELAQMDGQAQADYENFVRGANAAITASEKQHAEVKAKIAGLDNEISNGNSEVVLLTEQVEKKTMHLTNTKNECEFLIKYFDVRQKAMQDEIDACNKAHAILSGSSEGA